MQTGRRGGVSGGRRKQWHYAEDYWNVAGQTLRSPDSVAARMRNFGFIFTTLRDLVPASPHLGQQVDKICGGLTDVGYWGRRSGISRRPILLRPKETRAALLSLMAHAGLNRAIDPMQKRIPWYAGNDPAFLVLSCGAPHEKERKNSTTAPHEPPPPPNPTAPPHRTKTPAPHEPHRTNHTHPPAPHHRTARARPGRGLASHHTTAPHEPHPPHRHRTTAPHEHGHGPASRATARPHRTNRADPLAPHHRTARGAPHERTRKRGRTRRRGYV